MKGFCPLFRAITISDGEELVTVQPQPLAGAASSSSNSLDPVVNDEGDTDPFDLLSLVCESAAPAQSSKPKRKEKNARMAKTNAELRKSLIDTETSELEFDSSGICPELLAAVGDVSIANSLDGETANSILEAYRSCKQQHHSEASASCTFEDDPTDAFDTGFNDETEPQLFCAEDKQEPADEAEATSSSTRSSRSKRKPRGDPPTGEDHVSGSDLCETVLESRGASTIKLWHYRNLRFGNVPYKVRSVAPSGISTAVGQIAVMTNARGISYKATCSVHKGCTCWFYSLAGGNLDRVLQWIIAGLDNSADHHSRLSLELRESFGMKVRT